MTRTIHTILEATQEWVREMDAVQTEMIAELMEHNPYDWQEITTPCVGDRVECVCELEDGTNDFREGEIISIDDGGDDPGYLVELDDGPVVGVDNVEVISRYDSLPMWGYMWQMHDPCDIHWIEEEDGVRILSRCGFRVYQSEKYGIFFGIDGAGYDFYDEHWIPLYKARGLKWHDEEEL